MITIVLGFALVLCAGVLFVRLWGLSGLSRDLEIGSAFLLGCVLLTVSMVLLSAVGLRWSPATVTVASLVMATAGLLMRRIPASAPLPSVSSAVSPADVLLGFLVIAHALYVTESSPRDLDYWAIWGLKAKVFFVAGGTIDWGFLGDPSNTFSHPDYPPLLTMLYSWLGTWGETWNDRWFGLVDIAFITSFLLVVRGGVSRLFGSTTIGAWTAVLLALPAMQARFGIADLPLVAFVTAGLVVLQIHLQQPHRQLALLGFLLLGGGALVKNEGLTFLLLAIVVVSIASRRRMETVLLALPAIAVAATWQVPRLIMGLTTDVTGGGWFDRALPRIADPSWMVTLFRALTPTAIASLLVVAVVMVIGREHLKRTALLLALPPLQLVVYLGIYAGSPHDAVWHVATSWDRISLHVAMPLLTAAVPILLQVALGRTVPNGSPGTADGEPA